MWCLFKGTDISILCRLHMAVNSSSYYEWLKKGKDRLPHYIRHNDDKVMLLAGLYDVAHIDGEQVYTLKYR